MGWEPFDADLSHLREMGATEVRSLRNGAMRVIVCREPRNPARLQWHMSISRPDRYRKALDTLSGDESCLNLLGCGGEGVT